MHTLLYLSYTACVPMLVVTDAWAEDPVAHFNLPSEPLPQALIDFYHQSGIEPGFASTPQIDTAKSNPVTGSDGEPDALAQLLKGTGYTFRFDTANSVDVIPEESIGGQNPAVALARRAAPAAAARPAAGPDQARLEQVNVTGSLIHGVQDAVAPLISLKQQQLAMATPGRSRTLSTRSPCSSLNGPGEDLGIDDNDNTGQGSIWGLEQSEPRWCW